MGEIYTHITIILDRSGSMESIRDDTIGGFNALLKEQRQQPGKATLTLVQFDTQDPYEVVHDFTPIAETPELTTKTYVPRASTPLLDAIGRGINNLEQQIAGMRQSQRPSLVVVVVITDGQENSSREFRRDQIVRMVKQRRERDGWQFVFLSADLDAINDALSYGFASSSTMVYDKSRRGSAAVWASLASRVSDYRTARKTAIEFTEEDRDQQRRGRMRTE